MKKLFFVIVIIICIFSVCFVSCNTNEITNTNQIDTSAWPEMPVNTNPNLNYFGYYHFTDRIEEVGNMNNSNIAKVDAEDVDELEDLVNNGFYVFIMIRHLFFENGKTPTDIAERWAQAKTNLAPYIDNIIGFYIDEPILTGKTKDAFHYACQTVRADFPQKRVFAVMAYTAFISTSYAAEYFRYCTDLGYDLYINWNTDAVETTVNRLINEIAIYNQDIWLIPKAFYNSYSVPTYVEDDSLPVGEDVLRWIKGSYIMAVENPRIVGIFVFVYDNDKYEIDLRNFMLEESIYYNEEIRAVYDQIGKTIIE